MKINISIEATPDEFRQTLGLPNISELQQTFLTKVTESMKDGTMDPNMMADMLGPSFNFGRQMMDTMVRSMDTMMNTDPSGKASKN